MRLDRQYPLDNKHQEHDRHSIQQPCCCQEQHSDDAQNKRKGRQGGVSLFDMPVMHQNLDWLRNEVKERTSMSRSVCKAISDVTSDAVCTGRLEIGLEEGPPYWNHEKALISSDDSFCLTRNVFIEEILANSDVPVGINKAMEALEAEGGLIPYPNSKDNQKIWRVQIEGGYKKSQSDFTRSRGSGCRQKLITSSMSMLLQMFSIE